MARGSKGPNATSFGPNNKFAFKKGDDPRRHELTTEDRRKGLVAQRDGFSLRRQLRSRFDEKDSTEGEEVIDALLERAKGIKALRRSGTGVEEAYDVPPDTTAIKLVFDSVDGLQSQKVEISSADVFASFARAMAAEGLEREQAARILGRVKTEMDPTQDADTDAS